MKNERETDSLKSLPFDERARRFKSFAQGIGMSIGGEAETVITEFSRMVVEHHKLEGDAKKEFEEAIISPIKSLLGQLSETNTDVKDAISLIYSFEKNLF